MGYSYTIQYIHTYIHTYIPNILYETNLMVKQLKIFTAVFSGWAIKRRKLKDASKVEVVVIIYQVINVILLYSHTHALYMYIHTVFTIF